MGTERDAVQIRNRHRKQAPSQRDFEIMYVCTHPRLWNFRAMLVKKERDVSGRGEEGLLISVPCQIAFRESFLLLDGFCPSLSTNLNTGGKCGIFRST